MRKPMLVAVTLLFLAFCSFLFASHRRIDGVNGYGLQNSASSNVVREIILPDSHVPVSYRLTNLLGFLFLAGSLGTLAADRHGRKKENY